MENNRFTIAVIFPIMGAFLLVSSSYKILPGPLNFNPILVLFGTLVMRIPLISGVKSILDRKLAYSLIVLTAYVYLIEAVAVKTGFPYGEFSYGLNFGGSLLGVPLALPLFYLPLALNAYLLSKLYFTNSTIYRMVFAWLALLSIDLVLDPGAVSLGFWSYIGDGLYHGVPFSNFVGWMLSGAVSICLLEFGFNQYNLKKRLDKCSYIMDDLVSFVLLWGLINLFFSSFIPVVVALVLIGVLVASPSPFPFSTTDQGQDRPS